MTNAYDESYLDDAMRNLGEAVDYAVNGCNVSIGDFFDQFMATGIASGFAKGVPKYVSGLSGTELVHEVFLKSGYDVSLPAPQVEYSYSSSYWCGWIIAYFQWRTGMDFKDLFSVISPSEIEKLYPVLHEASEEKAFDTLIRIASKKRLPTKLQRLRNNVGYTQRELAEKAGVNLRTLQQYEIRQKDINKASSKTLLAIARVLGCRIEDLMEIGNMI